MNKTIFATPLVVLALLTSGACREDIDVESLPVSIEGYGEWNKVEPLLGPVPGHGDSYRVMYRNNIARSYTGSGEYPLGSAIIKEIYKLEGADGRGDLRYKAVMRRIDPDEYPDLPIMGGWLFTQIDVAEEEFQRDLCWDSCHQNAPYQGAFFLHAL